MDRELREALNDYDTCNDYDILVCCDLTVIVEAARKYANPDYEGWVCFDSEGYPQGPYFHPSADPDENPHNERCGRRLIMGIEEAPDGP